jgi:hypothetical protein
LPPQLAQRPHLIAAERVDARLAAI